MATFKHDEDSATVAPRRESRCFACLEPINTGARTCPHCHSAQFPEKSKAIATAFKWIGGVTAVFSLVIGSASIYELYKGWSERNAAIDELVSAAQIQFASQDYEGSWLLLNQALELSPSSRDARNLQIPLAMKWLRNVTVSDGQSFEAVVDPLLAVLYRGVSSDSADQAANVYAHIGWANFLKRRSGKRNIEIDAHFAKALRLVPNNVYANAFSAHWMLNPSNSASANGALSAEAFRRFDKALDSGQETGFVVEWLFGALSFVRGRQEIEKTFEFVNRMRTKNFEIPVRFVERASRYFTPIASFDREFAEKKLAELMAVLPPDQLSELFQWLADSQSHNGFMNDYRNKFIYGRLAEASGDDSGALAIYLELTNDPSFGSAFKDQVLTPAIKRVRTSKPQRQ